MKKQVLRRFIYGLYILTTTDGAEIAAATVTWVAQVSFEPPLVMVAMRNDGKTLKVCQKASSFALHVIGAGQQEIASTFFKAAMAGEGTLSGYSYAPGPATGAPILQDLPAWIEAVVQDTIPAGDHTIVFGLIVNTGLPLPDTRLLTLRDTPWQYGG